MPPKELLKDLFKGSDKFIVSPIDSSEYSAIEKFDADSVFTLEPSRDATKDNDNDFVDYPYNVDIYGPKNKGKDILLAISNGKRITEPVHAIIDTEFVTDESEELMTIEYKIKVNRKEMRAAIEKIIWAYKHPKPRKTTYKTIRHDCAKRNGRK